MYRLNHVRYPFPTPTEVNVDEKTDRFAEMADAVRTAARAVQEAAGDVAACVPVLPTNPLS